jgi:hypothetical protein
MTTAPTYDLFAAAYLVSTVLFIFAAPSKHR